MVLVTLFTNLSDILSMTRDVGVSPDSSGKEGRCLPDGSTTVTALRSVHPQCRAEG